MSRLCWMLGYNGEMRVGLLQFHFPGWRKSSAWTAVQLPAHAKRDSGRRSVAAAPVLRCSGTRRCGAARGQPGQLASWLWQQPSRSLLAKPPTQPPAGVYAIANLRGYGAGQVVCEDRRMQLLGSPHSACREVPASTAPLHPHTTLQRRRVWH